MSLSSNELREKFQAFFESKGHARIGSAPLVPENDPSVLFTTAGMHPLVPFLKGEKHPAGDKLTDVQICLRTTDIDEVGDATHATVFEMLGNWSLGAYFKEDAIKYSWEFLTEKEWLGLDPNYLAVSVFEGNESAPRDEESADVWKSLGVPEARIAYLGVSENWWPSFDKKVPDGPQGPDTEMFYWVGRNEPPAKFDPEDQNWVEIWNDVFMQFTGKDGALTESSQKNVDTGMGLERVVMVLNGHKNIYEIDSFMEVMRVIDEKIAHEDERARRILADHIKTMTFLLGDKHPVMPSNTEQGYVLRRVTRRALGAARELGIKDGATVLQAGAEKIVDEYGEAYPTLIEHRNLVEREISLEAERFEKALKKGIKRLEKLKDNGADIDGAQVFDLYTTYGLPLDVIRDLAEEHDMRIDEKKFEEEMNKHRDLSRTAAAGKFKGGLADHSEMSVKYHTATHLLHQALRDVLGDHVLQKGSNITSERLRFDFSHDAKMSDEEKVAVERIVNDKIDDAIDVTRGEMSVDEAKSKGALGLFEDKYGDKVSVYEVGEYSIEICGGPHVENTSALGEFKIKKEESASAGTRRIKAVLV